MGESDANERVKVSFRLRLDGRRFDAEARVPAGPTAISALLPVLHPLADAVVGASVSRVEAEGGKVQCRAGCGACCRQPVPIAEAEAVALVELVGKMPEARRRRVEAGFDAAVEALERAGLADELRDLAASQDTDERQALGRAYFELGLACPFLDHESCSIHGDRPLACREYLVTSPAEQCADPRPDNIDLVPIPARPSLALFRLRNGKIQPEARSLVLVFAREWRASHEEVDLSDVTGPELLEGFVRGLAGEGA
jgi:Fe-S-cluster containining protein